MAARGQTGAATTAAGLPARTPAGRVGALRLSRRAKRGEPDAFAEIFRRHHQELYRYCLAIVRDPDDAEDALQATMAAALHSLPGESREIAVRPWLYRIAHNESISLLRRRRDGVAEGAELADQAAAQASQEEELATRERLRSLVADLGELPERQCSAIVMRELNGLSYAEIATALSCSDGGARQAVYEARVALREREEGRAMECERVRAAISDRDGRRLRGRMLRAHLKGCDGCRGFAASISRRRSDFEALCPPLPAAAAGAMLTGLVGGGAAGGGAAAGGAAGVAGAAGGGLAASAALKGGSIVAAVAIAAGAADVGGLVELPNPVGSGGGKAESAASSPGSGGDAAAMRTEPTAAPATGIEGSAGDSGSRPGGRSDDDRAGAGARGDGSAGNGDEAAGGGAAPGHSGGAPSGGAPSSGPTKPPGSATAPGQTGTNPGGGTTTAPGQTGSAGNSGTAPGHASSVDSAGSGGSSGASETAPGQTDSTPAGTGSAGGNRGNSSK